MINTAYPTAQSRPPVAPAQPGERRVSQFEMESAMTTKLVENLRELAAGLRQKLSPVLRPEITAAQGTGKDQCPHPAIAGIAHTLRAHNTELGLISNDLQDLLELVDL